MNPLRDLLSALAKSFWSYLAVLSTLLTVVLIPSKWYAWVPLCVGVLVVLAAYRAIKNYANQNEKLRAAHSEELDRLRQEHTRELEQVRRDSSTALERANEENTRLRDRIAALTDNATKAKKKSLADIISELRDNLNTASAYYSGMPGNRSYIPPSTDVWRRTRNDLSAFVDRRVMIPLEAAYERMQRWQGIAESGRTNPDIGNTEIRDITTAMQGTLPQIIQNLDTINDAL